MAGAVRQYAFLPAEQGLCVTETIFFFPLSLTQQILEGEHHTALLRQNEGHYSQSSGELPAAKSFKAISSALESPWCLAHHRNLPSTLCGLLCEAYVGERFGENG